MPYPEKFVSRENASVEMEQAVKIEQQGLTVMHPAVLANAGQILNRAKTVYHALTGCVVMVRTCLKIQICFEIKYC